MNRIAILFFVFFLSSPVFADESAIKQYIDALTRMNQTEVAQLDNAVELLRNVNLTKQEQFEHIGQPAFQAVELALANEGYTLTELYRFGNDHAAAIHRWLLDHPEQAEILEVLEYKKEVLVNEFDLLIKTSTAVAENKG